MTGMSGYYISRVIISLVWGGFFWLAGAPWWMAILAGTLAWPGSCGRGGAAGMSFIPNTARQLCGGTIALRPSPLYPPGTRSS